jgi:hypothetical protein
MVAEEERKRLEREQAEEEERKRIQQMLETEEQERRKREAEVEQETERLRREFGMAGQDFQNQPNTSTNNGHPSPPLPPRPHFASGALPARPSSSGPAHNGQPQPTFSPPPAQAQPGPSEGGKKRHGLGGLLQGAAPYAGPAAASVSGFFSSRKDEDKRKKVQKKRSVHF